MLFEVVSPADDLIDPIPFKTQLLRQDKMVELTITGQEDTLLKKLSYTHTNKIK